MAAAVGLVVDDAVVMLEHMMRRLQEGRESSAEVRLLAASEMAKPLVGSTLATIIVFLPLALVTGVTGGFFKALALTMTAALLVSLVYARYLVPLIAARWLRLKDADSADRADHFLAPLQSAYRALIALILRNALLFVGLVSLVLLVSAWHGYHEVESGFMPKMDEGGFILDYKAKSGAALTDTDALLRQVEAIIQATSEVSSYSRRTGVQLGGGLTEADEGDFFIRLKDVQRRDIEDVMSEIRGKVEAGVPGLSIETAQLMEDLIGDLTAVPQPVEVKLFGDAPEQLAAAASETAEALSKISGLVEVNDGLRVAGDAIVIKVERAEAALFGLNPDEVATQAQAAVDGVVATQIQQGETLVNVRLRVGGNLHQRISTLRNLPLRSVDGRVTSLGAIASIGVSPGQKQLTRENLAPFVAVTARLEGRDLGSAMTDVMSVVGALDLPPGIRVEYGGLYKQQQQSFRDLSLVFVAALLLTALLLTVLFSSWKATLAALATVMLSAAAVIVGLWLTHTEMDISALMGLTMVVGMVTELVVFFLAELDTGKAIDHESVRQAGAARLRPILMSALIAILTLAPLALGVDRGAGLQTPMARAIIFGLLIGAPLVLSFLPAALMIGVKRH
jgi:multidrug efflux pump subunit AcrB